VAIGVDKNCPETNILAKDIKDGSVFCFDKDILEHIGKLNYPDKKKRLHSKQMDMLCYLWEMAYGLCLDPEKNVSENPGMEHALGVFGS